MTEHYINSAELKYLTDKLQVGDKVYLTGSVYTARDAAHSRLCSLISECKALPFEIKGSIIYFAGPSPSKDDGTVGSFGPTTSSRMDPFSPVLLDRGLLGMIGKGNRSEDVIEAIIRNNAVYFCAGGGFGALISQSVESVKEIAFPELGCESIKLLKVKNMPLTVAVDCKGNSIFKR